MTTHQKEGLRKLAEVMEEYDIAVSFETSWIDTSIVTLSLSDFAEDDLTMFDEEAEYFNTGNEINGMCLQVGVLSDNTLMVQLEFDELGNESLFNYPVPNIKSIPDLKQAIEHLKFLFVEK